MRLIKVCLALLVLVLSASIALAQESQPQPRASVYAYAGDFDNNAKYLTYWKVVNGDSKDTRVCGNLGYNGSDCVFQFRGQQAEKTRLTQVLAVSSTDPKTPHRGFFSARVKPINGEISLRFTFTFLLKNGNVITTNYDYTGTGPAVDYEEVYIETASTFNPRAVKTTKINIRNFSPFQSKVYLDFIYMGVNAVEIE